MGVIWRAFSSQQLGSTFRASGCSAWVVPGVWPNEFPSDASVVPLGETGIVRTIGLQGSYCL